MNYHHTSCSCKSIFSVSENKSTFKIENKISKYICEIKVDNGLITSGARCDYLYEIYGSCENKNSVAISELIYVELKGCDLRKAISQIESTFAATKSNYKNTKSINKRAFAITSRSPITSSELKKVKIDMVRKNGIIFEQKCRSFLYSIE